MLYLSNPTYSALVDYKLKRNELNSRNLIIQPSYKVYDKKQDGRLKVRVWDIVVDIKHSIQNSQDKFTILDEIKYDGLLDFVIDDPMKTIFIYNLPTIKHFNQDIQVLTSDILSIINNIAKKQVDIDEFDLKFINSLTLCVIDEKAKKIFPAIEKSKQYIMLNQIANNIRQEEDKIAIDVLKYKAQLDKKYKAYENAMAKKRKIFGIDPEQFASEEEMDKAISSRIKEVYTKRIENAKRHLESSQKKYIDLISTHPDFYVKDRSRYCFYENFDGFCEGYEWDYENTSWDDVENLMPYDEYVKRVLEYDTHYGAVDIIQDAHECFADFLSLQRKKGGWSEEDFYTLVKQCAKDKREISIIFEFLGKEFKNGVNLIWQISQLEKQIASYEKLLNTPVNEIVQSFSQQNGSWGAVMQNPCWVRYGRQIPNKAKHKKLYYHLLMTKPGTTKVDFNNIKKYTRKNGYEFGHNVAERLSQLEELNKNGWETDKKDTRCVCMLADSLCFEDVEKIVNEAINKTSGSIFVVESPDKATQIKHIAYCNFIQKLNQLKHSWEEAQVSIAGKEQESVYRDWIKDTKQHDVDSKFLVALASLTLKLNLIGVVVDNNYYKNFFMQTPQNVNAYYNYVHQTNKIKDIGEEFRIILTQELEKVGMTFYGLFYEVKNKNIPAIELFNKIDWARIDEKFLGGYGVEPEEINVRQIRVSEKQSLIKWMVRDGQFSIARDKYLELQSLIDNMPVDVNIDNTPDEDAKLEELFTYTEEASNEEYLNAIEEGLIDLDSEDEFWKEK